MKDRAAVKELDLSKHSQPSDVLFIHTVLHHTMVTELKFLRSSSKEFVYAVSICAPGG